MAEEEPVQFDIATVVLLGVVVWIFGEPALALVGEPVGHNVKHPALVGSAKPPVVLWCVGWPIALGCGRTKPAVRALWALGCVLCVIHIALAFHLGHGWSHAVAWEHTREVGGYGDGIFVNYAFALVWLLDAMWALVAFGSYQTRPGWLNGTIHGFLAFVVFNAAVVFGSWQMRVLFVCAFLISLVFVLWARNAAPATPEPSKTTDIDRK